MVYHYSDKRFLITHTKHIHAKCKLRKVSRYAMQAPSGELLLILNLRSRWGWVVSITLRPRFAPWKGPPVPFGQEAGWAPEPVWTEVRAQVPELWGAPSGGRFWSSGVEGRELFVWRTFILNEIWAQGKIYILVGTLLGWNILLITQYRYWLRTISSTFCRWLKL
jgi:hypothetical protein